MSNAADKNENENENKDIDMGSAFRCWIRLEMQHLKDGGKYDTNYPVVKHVRARHKFSPITHR